VNDISDNPYPSFDDIAEDARTQSQEFARCMHWRAATKRARDEVLAEARAAVACDGVEATRAQYADRVSPGGWRVAIDDTGDVRIEDGGRDERQDAAFKAFVAGVHRRLGNQIIDRLPPDTSIDLATGEVRIDRTKKGYW